MNDVGSHEGPERLSDEGTAMKDRNEEKNVQRNHIKHLKMTRTVRERERVYVLLHRVFVV